jgi:hypothetical protein
LVISPKRKVFNHNDIIGACSRLSKAASFGKTRRMKIQAISNPWIFNILDLKHLLAGEIDR